LVIVLGLRISNPKVAGSSPPGRVWIFVGDLLLLWRAAKRVFENLATDTSEQSQLGYTTDRFHGLVWRWSMWSDFQPHDISTFCPRCDMQLQPVFSEYKCSTQFHCDKCGFTRELIEMEPGPLENWVIREIQRKLRTGKWKQATKPLTD